MTESLRTLKTVFSVYRSHCGLIWRIMLPIAIPVLVAFSSWGMLIYIDVMNKITENEFDRKNITSSVDTRFGVMPTVLFPKHIFEMPSRVSSKEAFSKEAFRETLSDERIDIQFPPGHRVWSPAIILTDDEGITTWMWGFFNGLTLSFGDPMTLLLLTFCPLSLSVAHLLRRSNQFGLKQNQLTAREAWRQTGRKALPLLGVSLIVVFGVYLIGVLTALIDIFSNYISDYIMKAPVLVSHIRESESVKTWSVWLSKTSFHYLSVALEFLFLVAISLYNPCLVLEDNGSVVGVLRRSWSLVRRAKWRFIGIYLLTVWIISVIDSVLMGTILWGFSLFISDLAAIRGALSPLTFLMLFIGADIRVLLPQLLSTPVTVVIFGVFVLLQTFLLPIWAILTTYLYLERVDGKSLIST